MIARDSTGCRVHLALPSGLFEVDCLGAGSL